MGRTHDTHHIRELRRLAAVGIVTIGLLAACGGDSDDDASMSAATEAPSLDAGAMVETAATMPADRAVADTPGAGAPAGQLDPAQIDFGSIGRDVIVELNVQMESDDIARTVASITADAVAAGGGVASSDVSYGTTADDGTPNRDGHAVLVVKVPPAEVGGVVANLAGTGTVRSVNQSAQDVTDQLVDLDVRIANKRESVENVRNMMAQTTDLGQLVSLENELTWRQTELEQLEAQQRNLGDRVALSTITIEVRPTPEPVVAAVDDDDSIGDAFRTGWQTFRDAGIAVVFVVAALSPLLVAAAVVAGVVWAVKRTRGARSARTRSAEMPASPPAGTPDVDADDERLTPV